LCYNLPTNFEVTFIQKGDRVMCGRYTLFTDREIQDLEDIIAKIDDDAKKEKMKTGEIFPSDTVPVLLCDRDEIEPRLLTWGFPGFKHKQLIINARVETAGEKPMFRSALQSRRCVIPSTGFYEWDREKRKYQFNMPGSGMLYMAGVYSRFEQEERFVILTRDANASVSRVHHRMPVVLEQMHIRDWLADRDKARDIMSEVGPELVAKPWVNESLPEQCEMEWYVL